MQQVGSKVMLNPECEESRCRICYEQSLPMITLCECSGSIAYVHEECILDWITRKMETADVVEVPRCEICQTQYSAKLKVGEKRVSYRMFLQKILKTNRSDLLSLLFYCFLSLYFLLHLSAIIGGKSSFFPYQQMAALPQQQLPNQLPNEQSKAPENYTKKTTNDNLVSEEGQPEIEDITYEYNYNWLQLLYFLIVCPFLILRRTYYMLKDKIKIREECMVQIVELTLKPKITIKEEPNAN